MKKAARAEEGKDAKIASLEAKLEVAKKELDTLGKQLTHAEEVVTVLRNDIQAEITKSVDLQRTLDLKAADEQPEASGVADTAIAAVGT